MNIADAILMIDPPKTKMQNRPKISMPWNLYSPFLAWVSGDFLFRKKANIWQPDSRDCT